MADKLTPWFPPHIKPVRVGVYETDAMDDAPCYQHWNGYIWGPCYGNIEGASRWAESRLWIQSARWRGISQPTKD